MLLLLLQEMRTPEITHSNLVHTGVMCGPICRSVPTWMHSTNWGTGNRHDFSSPYSMTTHSTWRDNWRSLRWRCLAALLCASICFLVCPGDSGPDTRVHALLDSSKVECFRQELIRRGAERYGPAGGLVVYLQQRSYLSSILLDQRKLEVAIFTTTSPSSDLCALSDRAAQTTWSELLRTCRTSEVEGTLIQRCRVPNRWNLRDRIGRLP